MSGRSGGVRSEIGCGKSAFIEVVNKRHGLRGDHCCWVPVVVASTATAQAGTAPVFE
jgi:hypothetical protein